LYQNKRFVIVKELAEGQASATTAEEHELESYVIVLTVKLHGVLC